MSHSQSLWENYVLHSLDGFRRWVRRLKSPLPTSHRPGPPPPLARRDLSWVSSTSVCVLTPTPRGPLFLLSWGWHLGRHLILLLHDMITMNTLVPAFLLTGANGFPGETVRPRVCACLLPECSPRRLQRFTTSDAWGCVIVLKSGAV